ncbi:MAG: hypothetical protein ABIQ06_07020 [Caldimonas sp.]
MRAFIPSSSSRRLPRPAWLALATIALATLLWAHGPVRQWADYHAFADDRAWFGLANAANVVSNLPFLAVGAWALRRLRRAPAASPSLAAWRVFALALMLTALGSSVYHWAPSNASLVGDRLPIAWACAVLAMAFLGERIGTHWSRLRVLVAGLAAATLSVAFWWLTEQAGQGDLRLYLFVQLLPMLLVPLGLGLGLAATTPTATPARAWWAVLGCYAAAKLFELADRPVFAVLGGLSGHTLKHLAAAAGAAWLLHAVVRAQTSSISSGSRR